MKCGGMVMSMVIRYISPYEMWWYGYVNGN